MRQLAIMQAFNPVRQCHADHQHVLWHFDIDVCFRHRETSFTAYSCTLQDDLMADWFLASSGQTPFKIDPLR